MASVSKRLATDETLMLLVDAVNNTETVKQAKAEIQAEGTAQVNNVKSTAEEMVKDINQVPKNTSDIAELNSNLSAIGKCKNLLKPTLQTTTLYGITCTNNGDGTYTLNGTSTQYDGWNFVVGFATVEKGKKYKIIGFKNPTMNATLKADTSNVLECTSQIFNAVDNEEAVYIKFGTNVTFNNEIVKPMITENLNATYDDFVPYTGEGDTLTADVAELKNDLSTKIYELAGSEIYLCVSGNSCVLTLNGYNLTGSTNFSKLAEYPPYLVARNVVSKKDGVCMISVDPNGNISASDLQVASSLTGQIFGEVSWVANI